MNRTYPWRRATSWRTRAAAFLALLLAATLVVLPNDVAPAAPAPDASSAQARVDAARRESDQVASEYFAELDRYQVLGSEITAIEARITDIRAEAAQLREVVKLRAVEAYKNGSGSVELFLDGRDIADVARGAKLLAAANARDDEAVDDLQVVTEDLDRRRNELAKARRARDKALDDLKGAQRKVDANLQAALADQSEVSARLAAQSAAEAAEAATTDSARSTQSATAASTTTSGGGSRVAPTPSPAPPSAPPPPSSGEHPNRNDPFISCIRQRESGGNYGVVNPAGPWRGAYQFLQSTWNTTAQHAGRPELVGVLANLASAYDQDDMAWSLYQWQGKGPWGGSC